MARPKFSTAIHEAGHAVVDYFYGRIPKTVTIIADEGTVGHVRYAGHPMGFQPTENEAVTLISSALAGNVAERSFRFKPRRLSCEQDRETAANYAFSAAKGDEVVTEKLIAEGERAAEESVARYRAEIERVANQLMIVETMTGRELQAFLSIENR